MSTTAEPDRLYTPEDLLVLPDAERYELVDGHLVEPNVSSLSSWVEGKLYRKIDEHCEANRQGYVWPSSNLYRCFPHRPSLIRKPDVSFIRIERYSDEALAERIVRQAPDLAVEVVSPNDEAEELEGKVADYLAAGVRLVWLIFPNLRRARVHRLDGTIVGLGEEDALDGEAVLPGFRCRLGSLFPPRSEG